MSAFTKELRRREKLKQQQQQEESEEEENDDLLISQQPTTTKKMNVFALLNDADDDNNDNDNDDSENDENSDENEIENQNSISHSKKVSIQNVKPSKRNQKKAKKKALQQLELELDNRDVVVVDDNGEEEELDQVSSVTAVTTSTSTKKRQTRKNNKKTNKKRQTSASTTTPTNDEDNSTSSSTTKNEDDEFLEREFQKALQEKGLLSSSMSSDGNSQQHPNYALFRIDFNFLNPDHEFKKLFGNRAFSAANQHSGASSSSSSIGGGGGGRHHHQDKTAFFKSHALQFVTPKPHWPHYIPLGITCTLDKVITGSGVGVVENGGDRNNVRNVTTQLELFVIDDSVNDTYKNLQRSYRQAVMSHDPDLFMEILHREHPYHVHTLLQMSELFRTMYHEADQAQDMNERALLALQHALNTNAFVRSLKEGRARLPYHHELNRVFYHVVLLRLHALSRSGGHATAFELCKLLFTLSHIDRVSYDPAHILLFLDYYAIRAAKYDWMLEELLPYFDRISSSASTGEENGASRVSLALLPNMMFSKAFCLYFKGDMARANEALQSALIMWPMTLGLIVNEVANNQIPVWEKMTRNSIFTDTICNSPLLSRLMHATVQRQLFFWKQDPQILGWLKQNVQHVVNQGEISSNEFTAKQREANKLRKQMDADVGIKASYDNAYEQEVMGNMLPIDEEGRLPDMLLSQASSSSSSTPPSQQQNPLVAFLTSLLPWTNTGEQNRRSQS